MKPFLKFFDKLEDKVRVFLSHYPILYATIGGVSIVIFWRGIWEMADSIEISAFLSTVGSMLVLMVTGLFVSFFIGDRIILSGLRNEKKIEEKTESEVEQEEVMITVLNAKIDNLSKELEEIKSLIKK